MIKTIFWDFDGVLMRSNEIRDLGFIETLKDYPSQQVEELMAFHRKNGGLSRYVKFRYFFEEIRKESVDQETIDRFATSFSEIMRKLLTNPELLIADNLEFVKARHQNYNMHIVSGSDGRELNYLCEQLGIIRYFKSVHGSPTPKKQLVADLLADHGYSKETCILVGDSINDYDAAIENGIYFKGYGNAEIEQLTNQEFSLSLS